MRQISSIALASLIAVALAACGEDSGGTDETEPTFEQAQTIAEEQLATAGCEFQVDDESTDDLEQMSLDCLVSEGGEQMLYSIFQYTRDTNVEESDALVGGLTTATHYFENGNITVDPAGGDPTAVQLDAEQFATALKTECGCGEVLTPEP